MTEPEQKLILFYLENDPYRYYANFSKYEIIIDGIKFMCNEQYIMYSKAILFGDYEIAKKIMEAKNPVEIKKLGRSVKGFIQKKYGMRILIKLLIHAIMPNSHNILILKH